MRTYAYRRPGEVEVGANPRHGAGAHRRKHPGEVIEAAERHRVDERLAARVGIHGRTAGLLVAAGLVLARG
jgi:hypothetical protein